MWGGYEERASRTVLIPSNVDMLAVFGKVEPRRQMRLVARD